MAESTPEPLVYVTAQVPASLQAALREKARSTERSVSAEVRLALRAHVEGPDAEPVPERDAA